jgi:hypothetical protein
MLKKLGLVCVIGMLSLSVAAAQDATPEASAEGGQTVSFQDASFTLNPLLANSARGEAVAATPNQIDTPPGDEAPAHTLFTFTDYLPDDAPDVQRSSSWEPQIQIFDTTNFADYKVDEQGTFSYATELGKLQTLLKDRPELTPEAVDRMNQNNGLPYLPLVEGDTLFYARAHYLEFQSGAGVAYLTAFRLDVSPLTEGEIVYTFQGVTDDGKRYVSAVFPVDTNLLPSEIQADFDYSAFEKTWEKYLTDFINSLNQQPAEDFKPSLDVLDGTIQSLKIGEETK